MLTIDRQGGVNCCGFALTFIKKSIFKYPNVQMRKEHVLRARNRMGMAKIKVFCHVEEYPGNRYDKI
jgi:hypothetical protein